MAVIMAIGATNPNQFGQMVDGLSPILVLFKEVFSTARVFPSHVVCVFTLKETVTLSRFALIQIL